MDYPDYFFLYPPFRIPLTTQRIKIPTGQNLTAEQQVDFSFMNPTESSVHLIRLPLIEG